MKTIKVIDLLNKIANGEEVPKRIRIDHWCYKFEWIEHESNYYDKHEDIDLMSCLSMDKEELNYEVHEIEEEKKLPKKLEEIGNIDYNLGYIDYKNIEVLKDWLNKDIQSILNELDLIVKNQNQLIDYLESKEKGE